MPNTSLWFKLEKQFTLPLLLGCQIHLKRPSSEVILNLSTQTIEPACPPHLRVHSLWSVVLADNLRTLPPRHAPRLGEKPTNANFMWEKYILFLSHACKVTVDYTLACMLVLTHALAPLDTAPPPACRPCPSPPSSSAAQGSRSRSSGTG